MVKVKNNLSDDEIKNLRKELKDAVKKNMALYKNCIKLENKMRKRDEKIEMLTNKLKNKKQFDKYM